MNTSLRQEFSAEVATSIPDNIDRSVTDDRSKPCPCARHEGVWRNGCQTPLILPSVRQEGEWTASHAMKVYGGMDVRLHSFYPQYDMEVSGQLLMP